MTRGVLLCVFTLLTAWSSSFAQRSGYDPMGQMPPPGGRQQDMRPRPGGMDQMGSITGSVHSLAGKPLNDVQVQLQSLNGGGPASTTYTDQTGAFYFNGIPAGTYEVVAVSGMYQASDRVEVNGVTASTSLRIPIRDTPPPNDAGGSNTISVSQYRVPEKAREEFMKAREAGAKSQMEEAQKHLQRALEIYPNYADALTLRAIFKLSERDAAAAVNDTQKAIQADGSYAMAYTVLGAALNVNGSFDEALRVLQRSESLAPDAWQTYYEQGKAYLGKSDYQASMQQLDKAASLAQGQFPMIHVVRARALMGLNQNADAASELEKYLAKEPNGEEAAQARAMLEKVKGSN